MALSTNLQAYWKFDETSGDAIDSKNGNTAVNTSVTYGSGKLNNCAIYNGSAYHTVADNSTLKPTNAISISMWVNITSTSSYQMLLAKGENAGDTRSYEVRCFGTTTQLEMQMRAGGGSYIQFRTTTALTTGVWYHVLFTRTGTTNAIYINGIQETLASNTTNAGNIDYSTDSLWFGQRNGSLRFNGKLDEVSLFDTALTAENAKELCNSGRANAYPLTDTPSLYGGVAYYKLDESSGNAADSINSYTLTNVNTVSYTAGKINNGADGGASNTNKRLNIANPLGIGNTTDATWSSWVKVATQPTGSEQQCFLNHGIASGKYRFFMYVASGGLTYVRLYMDAGSPFVLDYNTTLTTGTWYHIVVTYVNSTNTHTLYINGTSVATVNFGTHNGTGVAGLTLLNFDGGTLPFKGMTDEVFIANRAINSTEVLELYNGGSALQWPFVSTPVANSNFLMFM